MLVIRLKPVGRKNQISFRIVVAEKRSKLNGPYREDLGFYNPATDKFVVKADRAKYWLSVGAQPSDTVHNIFVSAKVIEGPKKTIKIRKAKQTKEEEKSIKEEKSTKAPVAEATEATEATEAAEATEATEAAEAVEATEAKQSVAEKAKEETETEVKSEQ